MTKKEEYRIRANLRTASEALGDNEYKIAISIGILAIADILLNSVKADDENDQSNNDGI